MMRILGLLGLVLALVIVGLLFKHQQGSAIGLLPSSSAAGANERVEATDSQARQIRQQIRQSVDAALQTSRPVPDDN